jgi:hypothetical protein
MVDRSDELDFISDEGLVSRTDADVGETRPEGCISGRCLAREIR